MKKMWIKSFHVRSFLPMSLPGSDDMDSRWAQSSLQKKKFCPVNNFSGYFFALWILLNASNSPEQLYRKRLAPGSALELTSEASRGIFGVWKYYESNLYVFRLRHVENLMFPSFPGLSELPTTQS